MRLKKDIVITAYDPNGNSAEYTITEVEPPSHFTVESSMGDGFEEVRLVVHARRELKGDNNVNA